MSNSTLKSVVVLDSETHAYSPSAHNLSAEDAVNLVGQFSQGNKTAKVVDQAVRHRSSDPAKCKLCKLAAEQAAGRPEPATHDAEAAASQ